MSNSTILVGSRYYARIGEKLIAVTVTGIRTVKAFRIRGIANLRYIYDCVDDSGKIHRLQGISKFKGEVKGTDNV